MTIDTFNLLVCPVCKGSLLKCDGEIYRCSICENSAYPSHDGIIDFISSRLNPMNPEHRVIRANQELHDNLGIEYETDPLIKQQASSYSYARARDILTDFINGTCIGREPLLIDIGTGTGLMAEIARPFNVRMIGFDVSLGMLREARKKGYQVHMADAGNLPLPDSCVDIVTIDSVLHHLYDIPAALAEAYRILKPGGLLFTDWDPNGINNRIQRHPIYRFLLAASKAIRHKLAGRKETFSQEIYKLAEYQRFHGSIVPSELAMELKKCGFSNVTIIIHCNHRSVKKLDFFSMPVLSKLRVLVAFVLSFKLRKDILYDTILTLSKK